MTVVPLPRLSRAWVVGLALLAPLVASAALSAFREDVTVAADALVLVLVVVMAAATGDRVAGLAAALSSAAWFDFFLTEPYNSFTIRDADDIEVAVLLVLIGGAVTEVALWGRRQQERASRREGYLDGVLRTAELISMREQSLQALAEYVAREITVVLGIGRCRFVSGPLQDTRFARLGRDGVVTRNGHAVNVDRDGLPTDEETTLVVRRGAETLGYFVLTSAADIARPSAEQRRVAVLLADQMGAVLGRP